MRICKFLLLSPVIFLLTLAGCEKDGTGPADIIPNPYTGEINWNGFVFDTIKYQTPHAFLENWGENLDNLSADFDLKFTDGTFDNFLHDVRDYTILVYFDANSPTAGILEDGTYNIENTIERKPGNIVEAWVEMYSENKLYKFQITSGKVKVERKDGYTLITYDATLNNNHQIKGQYTGEITPVLQVLDTN